MYHVIGRWLELEELSQLPPCIEGVPHMWSKPDLASQAVHNGETRTFTQLFCVSCTLIVAAFFGEELDEIIAQGK